MGKRENSSRVVLLFIVLVIVFVIAAIFLIPCAGCNAKVDFVFSPGAEDEVIDFIRSAEESIDVQVYVFTSENIIRELGEASERGVKVRVLLEPRISDSRKQLTFDLLDELGVDVRWASFEYKITHSKFIIVDRKKALIGSINLSHSALTANREAAAEIEGPAVQELVNIFESDWEKATG